MADVDLTWLVDDKPPTLPSMVERAGCVGAYFGFIAGMLFTIALIG